MNYGIPYRGSKNKIAKDIIEVLPSGNRLVDLFAGGGKSGYKGNEATEHLYIHRKFLENNFIIDNK